MRTVCAMMVLCGMIVFAGCDQKPANSSEAMGRVDAAIRINNPTERDDALGPACRGAAKIGAVDAVKKGLAGIGNPTVRDEVASDSALSLRDSGQSGAATEVTNFIGNPTQRDNTLKKLAAP